MPTSPTQNRTTKYRWLHKALYTFLVILLLTVLLVPGVLRLIYRADSQVALGNAKSVRVAFQVIGTEKYGVNGTLSDASQQGGVTKGLYEEILKLSKVPGDFWLLQTDESGCEVQRFVYTEGEYTVWYQADAKSPYTVYHDETMIGTE